MRWSRCNFSEVTSFIRSSGARFPTVVVAGPEDVSAAAEHSACHVPEWRIVHVVAVRSTITASAWWESLAVTTTKSTLATFSQFGRTEAHGSLLSQGGVNMIGPAKDLLRVGWALFKGALPCMSAKLSSKNRQQIRSGRRRKAGKRIFVCRQSEDHRDPRGAHEEVGKSKYEADGKFGQFQETEIGCTCWSMRSGESSLDCEGRQWPASGLHCRHKDAEMQLARPH
jgi:hypothetical protein